MRRAILILVTVALSAPLLADTPPEIYNKAKEQFRLGAYPAALETLGMLEAATQKPEHEKVRVALLPALHFYRGACYAALGRKPEARAQFEIFLTYQPNASLDPAVYPKKVSPSRMPTVRREALRRRPPTLSLSRMAHSAW
jgi:tetratricopeptide (TPR) repeat protein